MFRLDQLESERVQHQQTKPTENGGKDKNGNEDGLNVVNNNVGMDLEEDLEKDSWAVELVATAQTSPEERRAEKYMEGRGGEKQENQENVQNVYTSFLYWREPVQDVELVDVDIDLDSTDTSVHEEPKENGVTALMVHVIDSPVGPALSRTALMDLGITPEDSPYQQKV